MIGFHRNESKQNETKPQPGRMCYPPESLLKSTTWQLLNGIHYLHSNWILHRDLVWGGGMYSIHG